MPIDIAVRAFQSTGVFLFPETAMLFRDLRGQTNLTCAGDVYIQPLRLGHQGYIERHVCRLAGFCGETMFVLAHFNLQHLCV